MGYLIGVVDQWVHVDPEVLLPFIALGYAVDLGRKILLIWALSLLCKINLAVKWLSITFSDHLLVIVQLLLEKFLVKTNGD